MGRHYLLRRETIELTLDRHHLTHLRFARHLGLSRSHWSRVFNRHCPLTPLMRRLLLGSRYLAGIEEAALWEIREARSAGARS